MHRDVCVIHVSMTTRIYGILWFIVLWEITSGDRTDGGKSNNRSLPQYWLWFVWGLGLSNGPISNSAILLNAENAGMILAPAAAVM